MIEARIRQELPSEPTEGLRKPELSVIQCDVLRSMVHCVDCSRALGCLRYCAAGRERPPSLPSHTFSSHTTDASRSLLNARNASRSSPRVGRGYSRKLHHRARYLCRTAYRPATTGRLAPGLGDVAIPAPPSSVCRAERSVAASPGCRRPSADRSRTSRPRCQACAPPARIVRSLIRCR
jgi:hypothetical protein